ncbi:tetratricopeptide repeat protein [Vampirovibrio sp.]|uniref:tetratricopeptide repeat protein n=1 Tax=Vampirovibrio sp. TaxID=2717857 RepID=UPI0035935E22
MKDGLRNQSASLLAAGLTLGLIGLGLLVTQASAQYHKTPRLSPRSNTVAPVLSPWLPSESSASPSRSTDSRIHPEPLPVLDSGFVPVSYAPVPAHQPAAPQPAQKREPQSALPRHAVSMASVQGESTGSESKATHTSPSEKALVYFPQDLKAAPASESAHGWVPGLEAGFYPVGYSPYLPAGIVAQTDKHQVALSYYNRGSHYGRTHQLSQAIEAYQKAIQNNPHLADAYVGLSSAFLLQHGWEEVFLNAGKALSLKAGFIDPANITQAQFNLSMAYCASADYGKAYTFYKQVDIAQHPQRDGLQRYLSKNCKP